GLGIAHAPDETVYHVLFTGTPYERAVKSTFLTNFELMPASADLAGALVELVALPDRERFLRQFVDSIRDRYRFVLIDMGPSLNLLTINGLVASDEVLVPIQCEYLSLEGLGQLLATIDLVKTNLGHTLAVAGGLLTMYDKREKLSREVAREVRRRFPHHVFDVEIPRSVSLAESPSFQRPVVLYAPQSPGAAAYERLAAELVARDPRVPSPPPEAPPPSADSEATRPEMRPEDGTHTL
ncbi:MAG: AAA family ATPase, partial [Patescibacteria group bacterium]